MVRVVVVLAAIVLAVAALPAELPEMDIGADVVDVPDMPAIVEDVLEIVEDETDISEDMPEPDTADNPTMPEPGDLALEFRTEEEFEDYLDQWFEEQHYLKTSNVSSADPRSGCQFRVNGDLANGNNQPQPVYIHNNNYLLPDRNTGVIRVNAGARITIACPGSGRLIRHPNIAQNVAVANANCVSGTTVSGAGWLRANGAFSGLTCNSHAYHTAERTNQRCWGNFPVIRVGFWVQNVFHPLYWSCFDPNRLEVLFVWFPQNPSNAVFQSRVDRPSWLAGPFFPGVNINQVYTQVSQRAAIAAVVGNDLANRYVTSTQFMSRGHLCAKSDMIFATGQRATFWFINAAPQWQPFNAGNWNWLEQNLRTRIGAAGYHTTIWTGTFGITQLRNQQNNLVNIFLHNNRHVPVPLYFYKVVYDAGRRQGTAFISINNPYYTAAEVRQLQFCTDRCRGNSAFNWLRWQPDRIDIGYSFCCTVDDFRRRIPHLPNFVTTGLLA